MNAEDLVITFKRDISGLSRTERRRAIESVRDVIRAAAFDDAAGSTYEVERCPRCGSVAIVKKGKSGNGEQRCLCRGCGRTFGMGSGRILGTSRLPRETWMAYAECFVLMLPLRECARRCRVCLKTAYTMRHRLIECLSAYCPSFRAGRGCELDETYFPESFKGNHAKGSFAMPRPSRHRGKQVHRRGLSRERICVMTGVNDSNDTFLEVTGRGALSRGRAMDALRGRIAAGSVVATDRAAAYVGVLAELEVAAHAAYDPKDRSGGTVNRVNTVHSLLDSFMGPFRGVSTKHLGAYLDWFRWCRTFIATDPGTAERTVARQLANGVCRSRVRDMFNVEPSSTWTTGTRPPRRDGRMVAPRHTRRGEAMPSNIPATTIRIDPEVKREATAILDELGLSMSTAVNAFLRALVREGGMPFELKVKAPAPGEETAGAGGPAWDDRVPASGPSDLGHIAPLPKSNPARGRLLCNCNKMIGRNVNPGLIEPKL